MAEQPQDGSQSYGLNTPREIGPVQPTETFKPLNYTAGPHQALPTQEMQNAAAPAAAVYTPAPGQFAPPAPLPARKKRGGAGVWILGGCGVAAVLGILFIVAVSKNVMGQMGKSDVMNKSLLRTASRDLVEIRAGLDKYRQAHQGKYPTKLSDAVDPSYLTYTSTTGDVKAQYASPASAAPDDTTVARFDMGQFSLTGFGKTVNQRNRMCLLKNGTLVLEQISQTPIPED